jgi:hypothetical protein
LDAARNNSINIEKLPPTKISLDLRWREMRKAVDAADKHSTYDLIEQLQAENQILKHQVLGYEKVFKFKE